MHEEPRTATEPARGEKVRVVGIDAAGKSGWMGVVLDADGFVAARSGSLVEIIEWSEPVDVVAIDIPIGNVPGGRRADAEARTFIRPLSSSVFPAPPPEILQVAGYADANALLTKKGMPMMSRQAWALIPKLLEAATVAAADQQVHEVHPEVSFRELAGEPIRWGKKSWNGAMLRRRLLRDAGIELPDTIEDLGRVAADDVLDAAAAAWSARRIATGEARSLPAEPEQFGGREVAIWC